MKFMNNIGSPLAQETAKLAKRVVTLTFFLAARLLEIFAKAFRSLVERFM